MFASEFESGLRETAEVDFNAGKNSVCFIWLVW